MLSLPSAVRLHRVFWLTSVIFLLIGCGELPEGSYPCLVDQGRYDTFNEAYVFAPAGGREAVVTRAQEAERECNENDVQR